MPLNRDFFLFPHLHFKAVFQITPTTSIAKENSGNGNINQQKSMNLQNVMDGSSTFLAYANFQQNSIVSSEFSVQTPM